ncbi:MAG TPA: glycine--tRNA ligase subunit beta, partial [Desulfosarcina sp.]|nr:glycine--tRNA ligase subunit beta [Desulfosarcina sp.]
IGILQIMRSRGITVSLADLVAKGVAQFADKSTEPPEHTTEAVMTFLKNRLSRLLADEGLSKDVVAAVISVSADRIPDVERRAAALEALKGRPGFEPLAAAFKRVENILRKTDQAATAAVAPELFEHPSEKALHAASRSVAQTVDALMRRGELEEALAAIATLRDPVDAFFDDVMVMADDAAVRGNRLALLASISGLFGQIADFSQIAT